MKSFNFKPKKKQAEEVPENYQSPLSTGKQVDIEGGNSNARLAATITTRFIKGILAIVLALIAIVAIVYSIMAGSLMFLAPSTNPNAEDGRIWVTRGGFVGGNPKVDDILYASASVSYDPNNKTPTEKFLKWGSQVGEGVFGVENHIVAKAITGPYNKISSKDGFIVIDGNKTKYKSDVEEFILANSFLALCLEGSCDKGELIEVKKEYIIGEVRGIVSLTGVKPYLDVYEGQGNGTEAE